jgi:hypothetical protein
MAQKTTGIIAGVIAGIVAAVVASRGVSTLLGGSVMKAKHGASVSVPAGWKNFHSADAKFSIATPANYTQADPRSPDIQKAGEEIAKFNPEMRNALQQFAGNPDVKLFAVDLASGASGFATNINVIKKTMPSGLVKSDKAMDEFRKGMESSLPSSAKILKVEFAELAAGTAVLSEVELTINGAGGAVTERSAIYMIPDGNDSYTITFASAVKDYDKLRPVFTSVANSFRLD